MGLPGGQGGLLGSSCQPWRALGRRQGAMAAQGPPGNSGGAVRTPWHVGGSLKDYRNPARQARWRTAFLTLSSLQPLLLFLLLPPPPPLPLPFLDPSPS
eukprot:7875331-Pyramimonas_sp.AAC.1